MTLYRKELDPKETALLVIDVQKEFCDPEGERGTKRTAEIAGRIQKIAPAFRKAGVPVFAVYFSHRNNPKPSLKDAAFYKFAPNKKDHLIPKTTPDAIMSSNLIEILEKNKIKNLLVAGFNIRSCIKETVFSALAYQFNVTLLDDLSGSDRGATAQRDASVYKRMMKQRGAKISKAQAALTKMKK